MPVEVAAVALAAVIGTWVIAAPGTVSGWERQIFASINGLADWLFPILWGPMQMGALLGAAIVVVGFLVMGRRPCAATYAAASAGGWLVAAAVKEIVARPRPLGAGIDAIVRGTAASGLRIHLRAHDGGIRRCDGDLGVLRTPLGSGRVPGGDDGWHRPHIRWRSPATRRHRRSCGRDNHGRVGDVGRAADSLTPLEASQQHQSH